MKYNIGGLCLPIDIVRSVEVCKGRHGLAVLPGDPRLPADAGHPRPPLGLRVLGVAVLEAGEAGRAARGAGAAPPAPPTPLPGHGRGLDEAGVGLAVVSLEGVAAVLGRWRRYRGGHLGGSLLVLRNLLLKLAIGITILSNKLERFTTLILNTNST